MAVGRNQLSLYSIFYCVHGTKTTNKQTSKPRLQQNAAQLQMVFTELDSCSLKHDSSSFLAQSLTVTLLPSNTVVQLSALPVDHLCDLIHLLCHPSSS